MRSLRCIALLAAGVFALTPSASPGTIDRGLSTLGGPAQAAFAQGVALVEQGKLEEAEASFRKSLEIEPRQAASRVGLGEIAAQQKRYSDAEALFRQALESEPQSAGAQTALGRFLFFRQRYKEAETVFKRALELAPEAAAIHIDLGGVYHRGLNRLNDAIAAYREGLRLDPSLAGGHFALGTALRESGDMAAAEQELKAAAALTPGNPLPWIELGEAQVSQNKRAEALESYRKALEGDPKSVELQVRVGDLHFGTGDYTKALEAYRQADQLAPRTAAIKAKLGLALHSSGKTKEARASYEEAVQLDGGQAVAYNNLAWIAAESGEDLDRALAWGRKAVELAPKDPAPLTTLAWVHRGRKEYAEALRQLDSASRLAPGRAVTHYYRGRVCQEMGDPSAAREAFQKALSMSEDFEGARDARARLARLQ